MNMYDVKDMKSIIFWSITLPHQSAHRCNQDSHYMDEYSNIGRYQNQTSAVTGCPIFSFHSAAANVRFHFIMLTNAGASSAESGLYLFFFLHTSSMHSVSLVLCHSFSISFPISAITCFSYLSSPSSLSLSLSPSLPCLTLPQPLSSLWIQLYFLAVK